MKRKKPRPFRWWIVVLLVVAAAVVTGILLGSDKKETRKRAPSATGSPGIETSEGRPLAQGGGAMDGEGQEPTTDGQRLSAELKILSPDGTISSSEGYSLSKEGRIVSPEGKRLSSEWKIVSPDGTISSPEDYSLSKEGRIVSPEGKRLSSEWKIVSPDGTISSSEGYSLSKEGRIVSPEGEMLSSEWKIVSPDGTISAREAQRLLSLEGSSEAPLLIPPNREEDDCLQVRQDLEDFFSYLDGRDYVQRLKPGIDTRAWFRDLVRTLSSSPPIPGGEGLDFQIMARNIFHFYRIMDKNDIRLVLEILANEREALEMNLDLFFEWSLRKRQCPDPERFRLDETVLYRYAGFFLNTIGGRSYLSRRSSSLRILITYYAILIVHERDKNGSNTYGIDPVPYIAPLVKEITMQKDLHFQNDYLQQLTRVSDYYINRR
jgi:hypothetical protein